MTNNRPRKDSGLAATVRFEANGERTRNITPVDYARHIDEQEMMTPQERELARANFTNPDCQDVIEAGKRKNLCVVVSRVVDKNTKRFLRFFLPCINDVPDEIVWKARSPLVIDVGRIAARHVQGQANIHDSQGGIRIAVTQALAGVDAAILAEAITLESDPAVMRRAMNETFVHEMFHKLATQRDQSKNPILSRDDWIEIMRVNGVHTLTILTPEQYEQMAAGEHPTLRLDAIPIEKLPQDPVEFMDALKRRFNHPFFYSADPHELVAFSATNVDLTKSPNGIHNPLHDLEATRSIMRRGLFRAKNDKGEFENHGHEFDGTRWKKYNLGRARDGRFETMNIEVAKPKMLAYEKYLRERFDQKDLLHEHDLVKKIIHQAEILAEKELPFAWSRLSADDQNRIQETARRESIDVREMTIAWVVQETLFDVITEVFGLEKCNQVRINDSQGFIAMTGRSSLVISTAPDAKNMRTMSYHPLSVRPERDAMETRGRLNEDVRIGGRVCFGGIKTSAARRLVRFSPQNQDAATEATALFASFTGMLKDFQRL